MPHNTREQIDKFTKQAFLFKVGEGEIERASRLVDCVTELLAEKDHQLQKAREEERMGILKIALTMGDCPINNPKADAGWMKFQHDFCLKLTKDNKKSILSGTNHSELDQDEQ